MAKVGSDKSRAKVGGAKMGHQVSAETRAKISAASRGRVTSEETKAKLRAAGLGRRFSDETRAKISAGVLASGHRKGAKTSEETKAKMRAARHPGGRNASNWKGGRPKFTRQGYVLIRDPGLPDDAASVYILEHRWVMATAMGRALRQDEHVHHRDGDKANNRIENLCLMSQSEHMRLHGLLKRQRARGLSARLSPQE
jgi:hypothetical protein